MKEMVTAKITQFQPFHKLHTLIRLSHKTVKITHQIRNCPSSTPVPPAVLSLSPPARRTRFETPNLTVHKTRLFGAARRSSALFGTQSKMNAPAQHPIRLRPCSATVRLRSSALLGAAVRRCSAPLSPDKLHPPPRYSCHY